LRPVTALTWNLHGFIGQDGQFDPERIRRNLVALDPDIAAFQEVVGADHGVDGFGFLRSALPDRQVVAANVERPIAGEYGQMLLSRFPIVRQLKVDLSVAGREPRRAIEVRLDLPGGPLRVICTHLGLAGPERRFQIGELCGLVAADPEVDTLLLGDINDWRPGGFAERRLAPLLGQGTRLRTFPSSWPLLPLDRIWLRSEHLSMRARTVREAGRASDHLPLLAEISGRPPDQRVAAATARSIQESSASDPTVAAPGKV